MPNGLGSIEILLLLSCTNTTRRNDEGETRQREKKKGIIRRRAENNQEAKQGKNAHESTREFEDETGIKVSLTTIRDITKAHKLKWLPRLTIEELTEANQAKRLEYARAMSGYN